MENMQGDGRGNRDFFGSGNPFLGFEGFGRPGSLFSNFFGGRDPFDDPFFTQPSGSLFSRSLFGQSLFDPLQSPFESTQSTHILEDQSNKSRGPIIQELDPDDEEGETNNSGSEWPRRECHHADGNEPYVQEPDDVMEEDNASHLHNGNSYTGAAPSTTQSQGNAYKFSSSTITYGGVDGSYYTSSTTRRTGGDGVTVEESKEADITTGKATHRISRGLHGKGHSVTRKLSSDGRIGTTQTLHNLNEDELSAFEDAWMGNANQHLPGWNHGPHLLNHGSGSGTGGSTIPFREQQCQEPPRTSWHTTPSANASTRRRIVIE